MGTTEDIAIGGLRVCCKAPPPNGGRLTLLFNLPTGSCVRTDALVRYTLRGRFGAQFASLPQDARDALGEYTQNMLGFMRRGGRVAKRFHITLRPMTSNVAFAQLAETVILSRNGGRAVCRARFKIGEELRLSWPEKNREAQIRVVSRQLCGTGELTELGFEFVSDQNFWGPELQ